MARLFSPRGITMSRTRFATIANKLRNRYYDLPLIEMHISTISGHRSSPLGLAAYPDQDPACVEAAAAAGINYFFFYSPSSGAFVSALRRTAKSQRNDIIIAAGTGARSKSGLQAARRKSLAATGADLLD